MKNKNTLKPRFAARVCLSTFCFFALCFFICAIVSLFSAGIVLQALLIQAEQVQNDAQLFQDSGLQ
jgi:hypothetical protein